MIENVIFFLNCVFYQPFISSIIKFTFAFPYSIQMPGNSEIYIYLRYCVKIVYRPYHFVICLMNTIIENQNIGDGLYYCTILAWWIGGGLHVHSGKFVLKFEMKIAGICWKFCVIFIEKLEKNYYNLKNCLLFFRYWFNPK